MCGLFKAYRRRVKEKKMDWINILVLFIEFTYAWMLLGMK